MTLGLKILIPLSFVIFAVSYFTVWQKDLSIPLVSAVFTVLFALPALFGLVAWAGVKKSLFLFLSLSVFSYFIESLGLITGFPYGEFSYSSKVGILIFNFIPVTLPFAWIPLLLGAFSFSYHYKSNALKFFFLTVLLTVLIDIVLDPGAVNLGFWKFSGGGIWYGVPLSNFIGWLISGAIGFMITKRILKGAESIPPQYMSYSYLYSLVFWTGVCVFSGIWGGVIIGVILLAVLFKILTNKHLSSDS